MKDNYSEKDFANIDAAELAKFEVLKASIGRGKHGLYSLYSLQKSGPVVY